jgi:hypothetical protein
VFGRPICLGCGFDMFDSTGTDCVHRVVDAVCDYLLNDMRRLLFRLQRGDRASDSGRDGAYPHAVGTRLRHR